MATDNNEVILKFKSNGRAFANQLDKVSNACNTLSGAFKNLNGDTQAFEGTLEGVDGKAKDVAKSTKQAGEGAKESGKKAKESESFWSKLGRSLKRIFLYRAIRKVLSEIGQGAKEGLQNLYAWSTAVGSLDVSNTKANLDSLSSASLYLKNSLGAVLGQAIQILTPLFINLGNAIGYAINMVSAFIRALGGHSDYTFAKPDVFSQWKSDLGGATSSAKELRRVLLGFDEVNRLDMETPSGGGGGGGLNTDTSDMFDIGVVPEKVQNLAKLFKDLLPVVGAIGTALGLWKISEKLNPTLTKMNKLINATPSNALMGATALGAVAAQFIYAYQTNEDFRNGVDLTFGLFKTLVDDATEGIKKLGETIWNAFPDPLKDKIKGIGDLIKWVGERANITNGFIKETINFFSSMGKVFEGSGSTISSVIATLEAGFYSWQDVVWGVCGTIGGAIENNVISKIRSLLGYIDKLTGLNLKQTLANLIPEDWYQKGINALANHDIYAGGSARRTSNISKHAVGGFPTTGQLFIARESGAELVGQIGGHTAVANNDQIVSAIEQGVYRAMSTASGNQNIQLNVDGKSLFDIIVARNNSVVRSTNKSPLMV